MHQNRFSCRLSEVLSSGIRTLPCLVTTLSYVQQLRMTKTLYYHPLSTPVRSVQLLAKQLGVKLTFKTIDLEKGEQLRPAFLAINPQHCLPTLDDEGFVLWESRAILAYLVDSYAKTDAFFPKDPKKRAEVNQRLYFDAGTLGVKISAYYKGLIAGTDTTESLKKVRDALSHLNGFLEGKSWVACDQKTIADYSLVPVISNLEADAFDLSPHPNIVSWLKRAKEDFIDYDELNHKGALLVVEYMKKISAKK